MTGLLCADHCPEYDQQGHEVFLAAKSASEIELEATQKRLEEILKGCDDGELFLEYCHLDKLVWSEGKVKAASSTARRGMGLRAIQDTSCYFAHSSDLTVKGLESLAERLSLPKLQRNFHQTASCANPAQLYQQHDPLRHGDFNKRLKFVQKLDEIARRHPLLQDVTISINSSWQAISGIRPHHLPYHDRRPRIEIGISVILKRQDTRASGTASTGGREDMSLLMLQGEQLIKDALAQAERMLDARAIQAGSMDVLLGAGWPGILLHEAIGHGLEGDFNRKQTSVFSSLRGQSIASKGVTVVDNGAIANRRGSLHIDDEGTATQATTLIEDGVLVGYMQDRHNARLMGETSTGNGRRQSYAHLPMPRMTNTYMEAGNSSHEALLAAIDEGIFAVSFGGGSVDITSGQFVFNCTEAYLVQKGKISHPVIGASIIGMGAEALKGIKAIGNNLALDPGMGMCGKEGQWVPVGVGQPSLLISGLNVGT